MSEEQHPDILKPPPPQYTLMQTMKAMFWACMTVLIFSITVALVVWLPDVEQRIEDRIASRAAITASKVDATLDNVQHTSQKVDALIGEFAGDWRDGENGLYWDVQASLDSETEAARSTAETVGDLHAALMGGKDTRGVEHPGIVPGAETLLADAHTSVVQLQGDLSTLSLQIGDALNPLRGILVNINNLTAQLDEQVKEGSPKVQETVDKLNMNLTDLDKLIANPDIAGTLKHVDSSAESIDAGLMPLRKKISLLKTLLLKALDFVRFTKPLP